MRFSKAKWLEQVNMEKELGYLTEADIQNAIVTWVDELDGKEIDPSDGQNEGILRFCK